MVRHYHWLKSSHNHLNRQRDVSFGAQRQELNNGPVAPPRTLPPSLWCPSQQTHPEDPSVSTKINIKWLVPTYTGCKCALHVLGRKVACRNIKDRRVDRNVHLNRNIMVPFKQQACILIVIRDKYMAPGSGPFKCNREIVFQSFEVIWLHGRSGGDSQLDRNDVFACADYGVEGGERS